MKTKKIKIYNSNWTIKFARGDEDKPEYITKEQWDGSEGFMCWQFQEIYVWSYYSKFAQRRILIHELTHAISWLQGINPIREFDEEKFCEFMAAHYDEITKILKKVYRDEV